MGAAWHVELTRHGMAGERHGIGMNAAWARHGMCKLALRFCFPSPLFSENRELFLGLKEPGV
jgi:hypothetical protein